MSLVGLTRAPDTKAAFADTKKGFIAARGEEVNAAQEALRQLADIPNNVARGPGQITLIHANSCAENGQSTEEDYQLAAKAVGKAITFVFNRILRIEHDGKFFAAVAVDASEEHFFVVALGKDPKNPKRIALPASAKFCAQTYKLHEDKGVLGVENQDVFFTVTERDLCEEEKIAFEAEPLYYPPSEG